MKSVGEVMAIGRTFQQAFGKAMRSRELDVARRRARRRRRPARRACERRAPTASTCCSSCCAAACASSAVHDAHGIDPWYLRELRALALDPEAPFAGVRSFKAVDTCAAEFAAETPYYYSGWERRAGRTRSAAATAPSVMILGSGPNRIGQGIEFDYCCVHAAMTVRESGRDAVMVNCNPETVSTDYDTSDRLYFEPLTLEDVLGDRRGRAAGGRDRPVRRPDAAQARRRPATAPACRCWARASTRSTSPRTARASASCSSGSAARRRRTRRRDSAARGAGGRAAASASRCSCARATCSAAGRWRSSTPSTACATTSSACGRTGARSSSTASWRTRSRSTSTRCATARTSGSAGSCSTSRRPASTRATRPACCRRTRSAATMLDEIRRHTRDDRARRSASSG